MDIDEVFNYHTPNTEQIAKYATLRATAKQFAQQIIDLTPASREQSIALTNLQQTVMFANAAIAINDGV